MTYARSGASGVDYGSRRAVPRAASSRDSRDEPPSSLFCENCNVRLPRSQLTLHAGRVLCARCRALSSARNVYAPLSYAGADLDDRAAYIRVTNWIVAGAAVCGIFVPPIGVPLQVWSVLRLHKLLGRTDTCRWAIAAAVPWLGLIPLKLMVDKAGRQLNPPFEQTKVFDRWQQERYHQLLNLRRIAAPIGILIWVIGALRASGLLPMVVLPIGLVGMITAIYAQVRLWSFRRAIRAASGTRIWFSSTSDAVAAYEKKL